MVVLKKNINGLSKATVYRIFKKIRESGSGRKNKKQLLKEDNTLSAEEIQQKMDIQGIKVCNSTIRRALKEKSIHIESQILNQCFSIRIRRR